MNTSLSSRYPFVFDKGGHYWLGHVIRVHQVGPYSVVEYHPRIAQGSVITKHIDTNKTMFSCYLDEQAAGYSTDNLDAALVYLVARRHEGPNTRAHTYFMAAMQAMEKGT